MRAGVNDAAANFGVQLIPPKSTAFDMSELHSLVVLAEDER